MSLEELKQQRSSTKKSLTRIRNLIEANGRGEGKSLSSTELKCRLSIAEAYFKQILTFQSKIESLDPDDNARADLEDVFIALKLSVQEQLGTELHDTTIGDTSLLPVHHNKLPSLKLPMFSGKYSDYKNFITSFMQVIDREIGLSNIEKFNHLRNCLQGPALDTINAFQITNENYPKALERLKARFDNSTLIFMENVVSLFEFPSMTQPDSNQLRSIVDNASALYSSLLSLGSERDISNAMLIHIIMEKVDEDSRNKWKDSLDFSKLPTWDECSSLLDRRCQYLQSIDGARYIEPKKTSGKSHKNKRVSTFVLAKRSCQLCDSADHVLPYCKQYKSMDVSKRFEKVKEFRLCLNCLSSKHQVSQCSSAFKCKICSNSHHTSLHRGQPSQQSQQQAIQQQNFGSAPEQQQHQQFGATSQQQQRFGCRSESYGTTHSHFQKSSFEQVILATAVVLLRGADGVYHPGRALLDSCSQVNFITDRFSQVLKATRKKQNVKIYGIGESSTNIKHTICSTIKSRFGSFEMPLDFCVTPHISYQPEPEIDISSWNLHRNISLADEGFHKPKSIDLLIGTEGFFNLLSVGQIKLGPNMPTLQKTLLGWVVSGRYKQASKLFLPQKCLMNFEPALDAQLKRRLLHQPELKKQYVNFMAEFADLGHMQLVKNPNLQKPHYYIPHHCVLKPTSTSTKLRVVFDASCKTTTQKSLNDILLVGATIQEDLYSLLLKFRLYRYAISADIVKMFRQVLLHEEDCPFQSILWRNDINDEISTYQISTVAYGTASAPFLAIRALHYLADTYEPQFPLGAQVIKNSFYVDDFLCGSDTIDGLAQIKTEVTEILRRGCLELAKWHSNHPSFVDDKTVKNLNIDDASKILMQELWLLKISWDESVPQTIHTAWQDFLEDLKSLSLLAIPRYCLTTKPHNIQLHGYCDASIRGYGCCIYLRVVDTLGNVSVKLLTAKSKVAPTKKKSLPKLELCGAKLLALLYDSTKTTWAHLPLESYLWTDSQIVLHWLRQHSATLSAFVGNRVSDIQELTSSCTWRHVPTKSNPADIVSRGCKVSELSTSIWFSGPAFLLLSESQWPKNDHGTPPEDEINREKRKSTYHVSIKPNYLLHCIDKISSYKKVLRVVAWLFRFVNKLTPITKASSYLTPFELQKALWCIIWNLQQHYFIEDIRRLEKGQPPEGVLKGLNPFLEEKLGFPILKVGGRLELADIPLSQKHPALLPNKCNFVHCLVRHLHLANYHAGAKALIALIRNDFWLINAREICRRVVKACVHCVRYKPKLLSQLMGNLPVERLSPCRPFQRCAVDFCGPINTYLRIRGKAPYKTYVAVFVCMTTKAVHIEVVSDLSTEAFLAALKRLIGRRGLPSDIFCDSATNFVGANNKLADLKQFLFKKETQSDIFNFCTNEFINFNFIPPRAPHFGGLWEAAVKSAKSLLNRTLMNTRLTYEELYTALVEIEAILNSRPISPLSSDPSDLAALTPAHFIIGSPLKAVPERPFNFKEIGHLEHWARISAVKQRFWEQWSHDYLNELQCRTKWTGESPNVTKGCMVVIHEDNIPPQKWFLGRVVECIPGKDGRIRVVDVRTTKGIIRRPIHKIAILPA